MKVVIISGSIRRVRQSHKVAEIIYGRLLKENVRAELLDLKEYDLPLMTERLSELADPPENLVRLGEKLDQADGIIIVSPEYNGSYPGVLKNALDYFYSEFNHKAISVATVSSGSFGGIMAAHQLQTYLLEFKAYPNPYTLPVPNVETNATETEEFADSRTQRKLDIFIREFIWFTNLLTSGRAQRLSA